MKKIFYLICLAIIVNGCQTTYENYQISAVTLNQVFLPDSSQNGKKYYLLAFKIQYCNPTSVFLGGSISPGLKGNISAINSIKILDAKKNDITSFFKGYKSDFGEDVNINGSKEFVYSNRTIQELIDAINNKETSSLGSKILVRRLFFTDTKVPPHKIYANITGTVIKSTVK